MSSQANRYALQLLEARTKGRQLSPLSARGGLSIADAYEIAKTIADIRIAQGEIPVGRKVGFANRKFHARDGLVGTEGMPSWSPLFNSTVRYVEDNQGLQSLAGALQPRIQPEVIFKLGKAPEPHVSIDGLADCIEWMAHGLEIVTCPYPDWHFEVADAIAAFGLHGALLIGEPKSLSQASRHHLVQVLADSSVSLSRSDGDGYTLCAAGFGSEVLHSPVFALKRLQCLLASQAQFPPLAAGEIVSTGAWAEAYPVKPGQTWITAFSGVSLPGLHISFV
ncbi:4-oxalocrotonate decarboxylase [Noviherbaspirillum sedimenti]|uniref:4-oxalocrotonate decarboxylase n=2 Tax=Noviherbaspirillum sedimenti TaxID=2320865 RepID=A0A3A3G9A8_9BURK|nr:4-oxalocrotonate decarboxylase [Noviherbaspirillum sedimenti]